MTHTNTEIFSHQWEKYITKVKGRIIRETKDNAVDYAVLKDILNNSKTDWFSSFESIGRWLKDFSQREPAKGKQIEDVLNTMQFKEEPLPRSPLRFLVYILPVLFAVGGFLVAMFFSNNWLIRIASAVLPAVLMFFASKTTYSSIRLNEQKKLINKYISQLESYSEDIVKILESP